MAVVNGTVWSVDTVDSAANGHLQVARVKFTLSGTYAQADNAQLQAVNTAIQNSRRNGRTVTLRNAMAGDPATKDSNPAAFMWLKTVAISTNDITFEVTDGDYSTELGAGAVPAQMRPFELLVGFTEVDVASSIVGAP